MTYPASFNADFPRRGTGSIKWEFFDQDIIPLWVADMDFPAPQVVLDALQERVSHGVFGYQMDSPVLRDVLVERMARLYNWTVEPNQIRFFPGLVPVLHALSRELMAPGESVLVQTPVYHHFIHAPHDEGRTVVQAPLICIREGQRLRYEIDFDVLDATVTPLTRAIFLSNPQNPVGRMWTRQELEGIAEVALRHNLTIVSDDIHCDLLLEPQAHIPIATLSPEVAAKTITLMAPSKTFNLAGLSLGFGIGQTPEMIQLMRRIAFGPLPPVNVMGYAAAEAAYRHGQPWLDGLLEFFRSQRQLLVDYVEDCLPGVSVTVPEATYLAWLDFSQSGVPAGELEHFLMKEAKVGLNIGAEFGIGGEGFARLNFACTPALMTEALDRIRAALAARAS